MQFVPNGPDIPNELLQAHEEGRVVFFCGAGISYPAGLPGFKGLVDAIYRNAGTTPTNIEQDAYDRGQYDATLDLLERRLPGQRSAVLRALTDALKPKLRRKGATETHSALLQLARNSEGTLRLVTTNFDRIFAQLTAGMKPAMASYVAPLLPIPKNSRWNGLVYLHGLLPKQADASELNRLVVTSGDFGRAYLTERWAARFVSEMFRNYVVCFVGYSINDPVLRYMMDALAADRRVGDAFPRAYALADVELGQEVSKTIEWEAKGVQPIPYKVPSSSRDHSALHHTLKSWAETYRDGILGAERIVVDCAMARPSASTQQDDFVSRMLWALSHKSGLPAKRFAEFDPVPPLEWLKAFSEDHFTQVDLVRFSVSPDSTADKTLKFGLVRRPAPYSRSPWMMLISRGSRDSQWDDVMFHLGRWLVRHLGDPELILWVAERGGHLHDRLGVLIQDGLDKIASLEREHNADELSRIRAQAPNAIPGPRLRILWGLLLAGRMKSHERQLDLYRWKERLGRDGLTTALRLELREVLAPTVILKRPIWRRDDAGSDDERLNERIDWEVELAADHVHSSLHDLADAPNWNEALRTLFGDLQRLLLDALDLLRELGEADDRNDRSHWDQPSIAPHWQNRGFRDWVALIELVRDAWLAICTTDPVRGARVANDWFDMPYPTFKRLALFAASRDGIISPERWTAWILADDVWALWAAETQREIIRLLVLQGGQLTARPQEELESAILAGPPRSLEGDDVSLEDWQQWVDRSVWLRLAKLKSSGVELGTGAAERLRVLSESNSDWRLATDERDEFSHWTSGTGDPGFKDGRVVESAPRKRRELTAWLSRPQPVHAPFHGDTWRDTCRSRFFHCALALCDLAQQGQWPTERWREALQVWSEEAHVRRSWRFLAKTAMGMPDGILKELAPGITWWMEAVSKTIDFQEDILVGLSRRIMSLPFGDNDVNADEPVTKAINHPIGRITQALLNLWFRRKPNDRDLLPPDLEPLFTRMSEVAVAEFRHGRVLLAAHLIVLFRVDRAWAEARMLPLFDWKRDALEARALWAGFMWSPRLYSPLLIAFKPQFLDTARHLAALGEFRQQFAAFLTYAALESIDGFAPGEFRTALAELSPDGLKQSAEALVQALEGAGEQREAYWTNHVEPFWKDIWPKSRDLASPAIAKNLARLCIAARGEFPAALRTVEDWLRPVEHPDFVVTLLRKSDLSQRFPKDALGLLSSIIDDPPWAPRALRECLSAISLADASLVNDRRYQKLVEFLRRHGA